MVAFGRFLGASALHTHHSIRLSHRQSDFFLFIRSNIIIKKLISSTGQITTTVVSNATGKNTYAIERSLSNVKGDTAIIVLLCSKESVGVFLKRDVKSAARAEAELVSMRTRKDFFG